MSGDGDCCFFAGSRNERGPFMKTFSCFVVILVATQGAMMRAQEIAPASLAGRSAVVVISSGSGSFAAIGGYRISFSAANATYAVSPLSTTVLPSAGTYSYVKTEANAGRITITDSSGGGAVAQNLVFSSPTSAVYSISSALGAQTGTVVFEQVSPSGPAAIGLVNMSVRAQVLANSQVIPGLVVDSPCRVLIRVAGPGLAGFGVSGTLPNPKLSLMAGNTAILSNDDWASTISNHDAVREAGEKAGAFPFTFGSKDAGLVADLSAGNYTCVVSGDAGTSGEVLLEVYRVPR
jgi:hypothetical protein